MLTKLVGEETVSTSGDPTTSRTNSTRAATHYTVVVLMGEFVNPCELLTSTKGDHIANRVRAALWDEPFLECY
jgi:hypothetical protein